MIGMYQWLRMACVLSKVWLKSNKGDLLIKLSEMESPFLSWNASFQELLEIPQDCICLTNVKRGLQEGFKLLYQV